MAIPWVLTDQATMESKELLRQAPRADIFVPTLWHTELTNVLLVAERRKSIRDSEIVHFFTLLESFNIITDDETHLRARHDTRALAREHKLSAYDATYLELAMRLGLPLATRDDDLRRAAKKVGVAVV